MDQATETELKRRWCEVTLEREELSTEAIADEGERFLRAKYRSHKFERQTLRPGELWLAGLNAPNGSARGWRVQQAKRKVGGGPATKRASSKTR